MIRGVTLAIVTSAPFAAAALAGPIENRRQQVSSTLEDFFLPGSQPNTSVVYQDFAGSGNCRACHEVQPDGISDTEIYGQWRGSMMAQSARDPLFYACLAIANQDAAFVGDLCLRCHTPGGWVSGRSEPTDGSALTIGDRDGVSCSVCHRMVDPEFEPGISPAVDFGILMNLAVLPETPGNGSFVLDPEDRRRGPFNDVQPPHEWIASPFHRSGALCGTCHDVSNPMYTRQADGSYAAGPLDTAHETFDKHDMFPIERTYSEWLHSDFATLGVDMGGRFGGNKRVVGTCQDCHMPDVDGQACIYPTAVPRMDLPSHQFSGGNAWVQDMLINLYPDDGLEVARLQEGKARSVDMLRRAASVQLSQTGNRLIVRITNQTGHKLPSGYPEGRRMWINVQLFDDQLVLRSEAGHYDPQQATLTTANTKVYETMLGIDAAVAALTGLEEGHGFHFALNNVILKDNRIPPRGFTNLGFLSVQAAPVGAWYPDGQYWDDTSFRLTPGSMSATVNLYYQTASREYIEFLYAENVTNDAGEILHEEWTLSGKSPPIQMETATLPLVPFPTGDANGDEFTDNADHWWVMTCLGGPGVASGTGPCTELDFDGDDDVDLYDYGEFQGAFRSP